MPVTETLIQGEPARLFSVVAATSKENRIAATFLAVFSEVPEVTKFLLSAAKIRVSSRTKIASFTEIIFENDAEKENRPDGLIVITNGPKTWRTLVEFKIGNNDLKQEQVERYLKLAKANNIDAVTTISNQFVACADHSPVSVPKSLLKKIGIFHYSWMSIFTHCQLLLLDDAIKDPIHKFLVAEFVRFLEHKSTGVNGFTQMSKGWKDLVTAARTGGSLSKSSDVVEGVVADWLEEQRDICLLMSRTVGKPVRQKIERKFLKDSNLRLKAEITRFCDTKDLRAAFQIPDAAADINVEADLRRRTIDISMTIDAPKNKVSTKARINWLLKMLKSDDQRIIVRAHWPSNIEHTQACVAGLRADPDIIQSKNKKLAPHKFTILLIAPLANRFSGSRTFIEDLERLVPEYYSLVGQHLKAWQPAAPKPIVKDINKLSDATGVLSLTQPIEC